MKSSWCGPPALLPLVFLVLALLVPAIPTPAQILGPGRALGPVSTTHFDFYFPSSLAPEARRLWSQAEAIREGLMPLLGIPREGRIPVLLTDEFAQTNGLYTSWPFRQIVLILSPPEVAGELGALDDPLIRIFTHELCHYLSLAPRGPAASLLAPFGEGPAPAKFLAPESLAEGLAVLAESRGGGGRLQDPFFTAALDEDLREGRRRGFWEVAGGRDSWPGAALWYQYGSAFSSWLYDLKGPEAMAAFWDSLASARGVVGSGPLHARGPFRLAFGQDLEEAWTAFLDWKASALVPARVSGPSGRARALGSGKSRVTALCLDPGARVFWVDASEGAILSQTASQARPESLAAADGQCTRLAISPDGQLLLVSGRGWIGAGLGAARVDLLREFDLTKGAWTARSARGLREASYLSRSAIVAIEARGMETDLVVLRGGAKEVLLRGSARLSFGSPCALGPWLYCLANRAGERLILRLPIPGQDAATQGAGKAPVDYLALPGRGLDGARPSLDWLGAGGGRLGFSLIWPGEASRLALLEPATGRLMIQDEAPLGGVGLPSPGPGSQVAWLASLSDGGVVCLLDTREGGFSPSSFEWLPLDPAQEEARPEAPVRGAPGPGRAPALPRLWANSRLPFLDLDASSLGLRFSGLDLTETLAWNLESAWAWEVGAADIGAVLDLHLGRLSVGLQAWDGFLPGSSAWYRHTGLGLELTASLPLHPQRRVFGADILGILGRKEDIEATRPYAGGRSAFGTGAILGLSYSDLNSAFAAPFPLRGWETRLWASLESTQVGPVAGLGLGLGFHLPALGLDGRLDLEASLSEGLAYGPGGPWIAEGGLMSPSLLEDPASAYAEYASSGQAERLYAKAELGAALADLEIQAPLLDLLWARRLVLRAGGRAALLAPRLEALPDSALVLPSAWARLEFDFSPLAGSLLATDFHASLELARALEKGYGETLSWSLKLAYEVAP